MGTVQRAFAAQVVAALIAVATGCHTPEPRTASVDWLRPLPPATARGTVAQSTDGKPTERALPPPDALDALPTPVPLPVVTPAKIEAPPAPVPLPPPLPSPVPTPLPVVETSVEWKPVGAPEPLKPPVVVPESDE